MRSRLATSAALALVLLPSVAVADDPADYAHHLIAERDYFRAISEYKALAFREPDLARRAVYQLEIGRAYRISGRPELSIDALTRLLSAKGAAPDVQAKAHLNLALDYLSIRAIPVATLHLEDAARLGERGPASLLTAVNAALSDRPADARAALDEARRGTLDGAMTALADSTERSLTAVATARTKSPLLAATLSAVLPGAGQAYTGHWFDAMQAFGFVSAFGFTSYLAYDHDRARGGPYVLTGVALGITTFFYVANILGAERTARYVTQKGRDDALEPLRQNVTASQAF